MKTYSNFTDLNKNLIITMEECAEVQQIASKILRFGLDSYHPDDPTTSNSTRLENELGDLLAMVDILEATGVVTIEGLKKAKDHKLDKLAKFYDYTPTEPAPKPISPCASCDQDDSCAMCELGD